MIEAMVSVEDPLPVYVKGSNGLESPICQMLRLLGAEIESRDLYIGATALLDPIAEQNWLLNARPPSR